MKEFVIVRYDFQNEISKTNPRIIGVFDSMKLAEQKSKELNYGEWKQIIKEGVNNTSFEHYADRIKKRGYKFDKDASDEDIIQFIAFLEHGEVESPYTGTAKLSGFRIVEMHEVEALIKGNGRKRYLIKEDYLFDTGEIYVNIANNIYGVPLFVTDDESIVRSKIEEFEGKYFIDKVLGHNARMDVQVSRYWKDVVFVEEAKLNEIELRLKEKGIPFSNQIHISQVNTFRQTLEDIVGIGITRFCSIDEFENNKI